MEYGIYQSGKLKYSNTVRTNCTVLRKAEIWNAEGNGGRLFWGSTVSVCTPYTLCILALVWAMAGLHWLTGFSWRKFGTCFRCGAVRY